MVFSSAVFLGLFLPITYTIYMFSGKINKNLILLIASLIFYSWGEPYYIILMMVSIGMNYIFGIYVECASTKTLKSFILAVSVVSNLALLVYFKYSGFIINSIMSAFNLEITFDAPSLPIGISFYTFQAMSYVIDVYRKNKEGNNNYAQKNIIKFALYISFFPQLIAGPIVKYHDIDEQLSNRKCTVDDTLLGIKRFIVGLSKKILIANICAQSADKIFALDYAQLPILTAWLGITCYTLQIYYDFSGYSDMAIGMGKMFGFTFLENFNYPYISTSIKEFWRRWHMSLSNWFKEYLYIPLGGNKKGKFRTYVNLFIVFFATGLWHGASWNFIIWGLFHGAFLVIERVGFGKVLSNNKFKAINHVYVLIIIMISWVFFRTETLNQSFLYIKALFVPNSVDNVFYMPGMFLSNQLVITMTTGILLCGPLQQRYADFMKKIIKLLEGRNMLKAAALSILLFLCLMSLALGTYNPFIYFRF